MPAETLLYLNQHLPQQRIIRCSDLNIKKTVIQDSTLIKTVLIWVECWSLQHSCSPAPFYLLCQCTRKRICFNLFCFNSPNAVAMHQLCPQKSSYLQKGRGTEFASPWPHNGDTATRPPGKMEFLPNAERDTWTWHLIPWSTYNPFPKAVRSRNRTKLLQDRWCVGFSCHI